MRSATSWTWIIATFAIPIIFGRAVANVGACDRVWVACCANDAYRTLIGGTRVAATVVFLSHLAVKIHMLASTARKTTSIILSKKGDCISVIGKQLCPALDRKLEVDYSFVVLDLFFGRVEHGFCKFEVVHLWAKKEIFVDVYKQCAIEVV